MKSHLLKLAAIKLALLLTVSAAGCNGPLFAGEWHHLNIPAKNAASQSYHFLAAKFGDKLEVKCDPDRAAEDGDEYLYYVMDNASNKYVSGEAIGNGPTLQAALDNAAAHYLSGAEVKRIDDNWETRKAEIEKQKQKYKRSHRDCCKDVQ